MIRPIVSGTAIFTKAAIATKEDLPIAYDLLDTLKANQARCVGMAANMIGYNKAIIVVGLGPMLFAMMNPVITKRSGKYETEEGCLSLTGVRKCIRYQQIEVDYQDLNMKKCHRKFEGYIAQIIQHEIDHCHGIVI